jgi:hypothetical protein
MIELIYTQHDSVLISRLEIILTNFLFCKEIFKYIFFPRNRCYLLKISYVYLAVRVAITVKQNCYLKLLILPEEMQNLESFLS